MDEKKVAELYINKFKKIKIVDNYYDSMGLAKLLGYSGNKQLRKNLSYPDKKLITIKTAGGNQSCIYISKLGIRKILNKIRNGKIPIGFYQYLDDFLPHIEKEHPLQWVLDFFPEIDWFVTPTSLCCEEIIVEGVKKNLKNLKKIKDELYIKASN